MSLEYKEALKIEKKIIDNWDEKNEIKDDEWKKLLFSNTNEQDKIDEFYDILKLKDL